MAFAVGYKTFTHAATTAQNVALSGFTDVVGTIGSLQADDYVVVWYAHHGSAARTLAQCTPSGYSNAHAAVITGTDTAVTSGAATYKKQSSTPDANVAIPAASSTNFVVGGFILVIRGADLTTFLDVTSTTASGANSGRPNPPSITPTTAGAYIIGFGASSTGGSMTPLVQAGDYNNFNTNSVSGLQRLGEEGFGLKTNWTSGAFDAGAWTGGTTASDASWIAASLALRPATGGGGSTYTLTADAGSFTLTGAAAGTAAARQLTAADGTFALTGAAANLNRGYSMPASAGAFTLTGANAELLAARILSANAGNFTLTGADAFLLKGLTFGAEAAAFTLTGGAINALRGLVLSAAAGSYTLTGADLSFTLSRLLSANGGAFTLTGADADLSKTSARVLDAETGSFAITGADALLAAALSFAAEAGAFTLYGADAVLIITAAPGWSPVEPGGAAWVAVNADGATWVARVPTDASWDAQGADAGTWTIVPPEGVTWQ